VVKNLIIIPLIRDLKVDDRIKSLKFGKLFHYLILMIISDFSRAVLSQQT